MTNIQKVEIVKSFFEGKPIQYMYIPKDILEYVGFTFEWRDLKNPVFNFEVCKYRIKQN